STGSGRSSSGPTPTLPEPAGARPGSPRDRPIGGPNPSPVSVESGTGTRDPDPATCPPRPGPSSAGGSAPTKDAGRRSRSTTRALSAGSMPTSSSRTTEANGCGTTAPHARRTRPPPPPPSRGIGKRSGSRAVLLHLVRDVRMHRRERRPRPDHRDCREARRVLGGMMDELGNILGVWAHPDDEAYLTAGI